MMKVIDVPFKRLHKDAVIPEYAHGPEEDAGLDLVAIQDVIIPFGTPTVVKTGVAVEMPPGVEAQIRSRSGLAAREGIIVLNAPGTIDPGYRGELAAILIKLYGAEPYQIKKGDRIAQIVFAEYVGARQKEAKKLAKSDRGTGGLGSTGR